MNLNEALQEVDRQIEETQLETTRLHARLSGLRSEREALVAALPVRAVEPATADAVWFSTATGRAVVLRALQDLGATKTEWIQRKLKECGRVEDSGSIWANLSQMKSEGIVINPARGWWALPLPDNDCPRCLGTGLVKEETCGICHGSGKVDPPRN